MKMRTQLMLVLAATTLLLGACGTGGTLKGALESPPRFAGQNWQAECWRYKGQIVIGYTEYGEPVYLKCAQFGNGGHPGGVTGDPSTVHLGIPDMTDSYSPWSAPRTLRRGQGGQRVAVPQGTQQQAPSQSQGQVRPAQREEVIVDDGGWFNN